VIGRYLAVFRHQRSIGYVLVNMAGSGGLFAFISSSPLVLMGTMGVSTQVFGLLFATTSSGILIGSTANTFLARRGVSPHVPLAIGMVLAPLAAIAATGFLLAGVVSLATFIPFVVLTGICRGITTPNVTHSALEPVPNHAGVTSALMGGGQMMMASLSAVIVAALYPTLGPLGVTLAMLLFSVMSLVTWLIVERRTPLVLHSDEERGHA
jgi:MFS transporter, DHA1 family, multidrug resistance protein